MDDRTSRADALIARLTAALQDLISGTFDPGTEALGAVWEGEHWRTAAPDPDAERRGGVEAPPVQGLDEAIAHLRNVVGYPGLWKRTGSAAERVLAALQEQRADLEDREQQIERYEAVIGKLQDESGLTRVAAERDDLRLEQVQLCAEASRRSAVMSAQHAELLQLRAAVARVREVAPTEVLAVLGDPGRDNVGISEGPT